MFRDRSQLIRFVMLLVGALAVGCGGSQPAAVTEKSSASAPAPQAAPPAIPDLGAALAHRSSGQSGAASQPANSAAADQQGTTDAAATEAPPKVDEERQVAVAGVGRKGKGYGGGIISTPVSAYFGARERIAFIAVTDAMRKFKAVHDRDPNSHEEFMAQIINENGIQLPALFEGERYEYDPKLGELMVVRPKK